MSSGEIQGKIFHCRKNKEKTWAMDALWKTTLFNRLAIWNNYSAVCTNAFKSHLNHFYTFHSHKKLLIILIHITKFISLFAEAIMRNCKNRLIIPCIYISFRKSHLSLHQFQLHSNNITLLQIDNGMCV